MSGHAYELHLLLRLAYALVCGAILGYERERHGISAGLRTNLIVCLGAALIMVISKYFYYHPGESVGALNAALDPSRIAAQIVTGVGFLGAGVIIKEKGAIRGLTTAATLWFNAGVGMACGAGMIVIPAFCTLLGLASLAFLKRWQKKIPHEIYKVVSIECDEQGGDGDTLQILSDYLAKSQVHIENIGIRKIGKGFSRYSFTIRGNWDCVETLCYLRDLIHLPFVTSIDTD